MNKNLEEFKEFIRGKKTAVLGVGISNKPLIKYIYNLGAVITAFDMADENDKYLLATRTELEAAGVKIDWSLGKDYLAKLKGFDVIFKTPKIRSDIPELIAESDRGALITSEMEVFLECCPCMTVGVTGSAGKTTTSTIISLILEQEGYKVHLGGNIGIPLLDRIDSINPKDIVVLELSSFQLQSMHTSPDVALITNVTPNHLDVHKDFEEYINAKKNIFMYQKPTNRLILNSLDHVSSSFVHGAKGKVEFFPPKNDNEEINNEYFINDDCFFFPDGEAIPLSQIKLLGKHNLDNYCAALTTLLPYVSMKSVINVMKTFGGVAHRSEYLRTLDGVDYYNSSIDSAPERTIATLKCFDDKGQNVVIIAGGKDKNSDYTGLGEAMLKVSRKIILCGQNAALIRRSLDSAIEKRNYDIGEISIYEFDNYKDAVDKAREIAQPGEAVVLTPSGTSFDAFRNFEERGELFRTLVNDLV